MNFLNETIIWSSGLSKAPAPLAPERKIYGICLQYQKKYGKSIIISDILLLLESQTSITT
jgi:hypothetical protein